MRPKLMTMHKLVFAAFAGALVSLAGAGSAFADDAVRCQIFEIRASTGDSERIDPRLRPIEDKLRQAPFRAWNVFEALESHRMRAERRRPVKLSLVPGGEMTLLYRDTTRAEGKRPRLRLSLTLDDADGKRLMDATIQLDSGDWYLVGGEALDDNATYILATGCRVD
jgi:hypothetical protein